MNKNIYMSNIPDLLEIQKSSFCWFLTEGLGRELSKFSYGFDLSETLELKIYGDNYSLTQPFYTKLKAKEKNTNYSIRIYLSIEIIDKYVDLITDLDTKFEELGINLPEFEEFINIENNKKIGKHKILIGEIPLMTEKCTFIINGCERVIISQLIRSPGVYYKKEKKKTQLHTTYSATVITKRGSWLTFELQNTSIWIKIDKKHKIPLNWFLGALDLTNEEIYQTIANYDFLIHCIQCMKEDLIKRRTNTLKKKNNKIKKQISAINTQADLQAIHKVRDLICFRILNSKYYDLGEVGRIKINKKLQINLPLSNRTLTPLDILKIIDYLIDIKYNIGEVDDIDSLTNRRVRCVGELVKMQVRIGLGRLLRNINEKLSNDELNLLNLATLINPKPLGSAMKEFFGTSQLSQFMDETNPLAELTHKRRVTALGPGGLSADHVTFAARDIHPTQYGRLCPIETPEGQSAGLVSSLASHAKINSYGFLETPFFQVIQAKVMKNNSPIYLTAEEEQLYKIAPADTKLTINDCLEGDLIPIRYNNEFTLALSKEVNLIAVSTIQIISIAAALIPFLEHDDANRALMGSNMQRQAVPLLYPQKPIVGTGLESQIAIDSFCGIVNYYDGVIEFVTSEQIIVNSDKTSVKRYELEKYRRSNQDTCVNQKPIVWPGQFVKSGELIADGPGIEEGELSLGQNLIVAYMPWEGYNYEDAILISERLVYKDLFTSIHIEKFEIEVRQTKSGLEEMTKNIPNVNTYEIRHLDLNGLVYKGAFVESGDILVGKITPKNESEELPEGKLLRAIFGDKTLEVHDSSFRVPKGICGRVIDVLYFSKDQGDTIPIGTVSVIRLFIAEIRKIKIGDKISGRHGNKGIISKILPIPDMPFLPDGTLVDVVLNPLGVPSRMNVGQIFECLLGFSGQYLNKRFKILPFDEMYAPEASRILVNNKLKEASELTKKPWLFNAQSPGKLILKDGRTGENFDNPILVGKSYLLKLIHLVDDKMHARSTGPYSLVTQQPLGGKSQQGGQRFGEMEVWALEAYGAAYTLQELLTVKSDDIEGRNEVLNAIIKGKPMPKPGVPESFKVLLRELHALGLNITTYRFENIMGELKALEIDLMATKSINNEL
jgi:DNA-directed RNA polymerase subunit beta